MRAPSERPNPAAPIRGAGPCPPRPACTTRVTSGTRAASRWWPPPAAPRATTSSRSRSTRCATSSTAARWAPTPARVTAPGCLAQMPDAFLRAVVDFDLPEAGAYAAGLAFLPLDGHARRAAREHVGRSPGRSACACSAGARCPPCPTRSASSPAPRCRPSSSSSSPRRARPSPASSSTASPGGCASASSARWGSTCRRSRTAPWSTRGSWSRTSSTASTPTCRPGYDAARALPPALQHQHLPDLVAGAAVPPARAQRRDQHAARQPQLDEGARARAASALWGAEIEELLPVVQEGGSDSAALDNVFELLTLGGATRSTR